MKSWKPKLLPEEINLYYELACAGDPEGITVFQFLNLPNIFRYYFQKETVVTKQMDASNIFLQDICKRMSPYCYDVSRRSSVMLLRNFLLKFNFFYYLNFLDILFFFIQVQDKHLISSLMVSPTICSLINICYFLELLLELSYRKGDLFSILTELDNIFLCLFTTGVVGIFGLNFVCLVSLCTARQQLGYVLFKSFRCCRIITTNMELAAFCSSVLSVGPLFCENMIFGLVILYMHGMAGNLLFGSFIDIWATPISATITVQKLFLPYDLLEIMELTMEKVHSMSILFFFIYFLMSIIVSNLSLSIVLEWHAQMFEELSKSTKINKTKVVSHDVLFKTLKERVISRKTNHQSHQTTFADVAADKDIVNKYSKYRMYIQEKEADYRMKFVDDIEHLSEEDLKACQKYSNIDLAAFSKVINRQQKDLTWETDFIEYASKDHMHEFPPGTTFIVKGTPAVTCYLVCAGTVQVESYAKISCVEAVDLGPINLLGSACLTPASTYNYTCTAVTMVECLIFSQDSILSDLDSDHAGQLLRMAHKTHLVLEDLFL